MKKIKSSPYSLFLYNFLEGEWPILSTIENVQKRNALIHAGEVFSDSYLFMNVVSNRALVTPIPVQKEFIHYVEGLTGTTQTVYTPHPINPSSPFLCTAVTEDALLFQHLVDEARVHENTIALYTYVSSPAVYHLARAFKKRGITVLLPETPKEKDLWTVDHFGSKVGFRTSFSSVMPEGYICTSVAETCEKAFEEMLGWELISTARETCPLKKKHLSVL
jgi:hypothetical protein